jgi:beta-phosphoglucomutase-like phosphatase (HAD superfamily)
MDGTLVDSNYAHVNAWQRAFREIGQPVDAWRIHHAIGMGSPQLLPFLLGEAAERLGDQAKRLHSRSTAPGISSPKSPVAARLSCWPPPRHRTSWLWCARCSMSRSSFPPSPPPRTSR